MRWGRVLFAIASAAVFACGDWQPTNGDVPDPVGRPVLVGAGDIADCSSDRDEATAKLIEDTDATVFTTGDAVYDSGSADEFRDCYGRSWGRFKSRTRPTPGNHEYYTEEAAGYFEYFGSPAGEPGQGWYSYDLGGWHIVVLNSNCSAVGGCGNGSDQLAWLRSDLQKHPSFCTLAYWHHPRFSSGEVHGSHRAVASFWEVLYDSGADVVISGHDHSYERFARQDADGIPDPFGMRQFVVGTGGKELYGFGTPVANSEIRLDHLFGVLKIELGNGSYDWDFLPVSSQKSADSGHEECHEPAD
ncbi:MAG: metallophosphoesterase [Dehalococcoidia bacterium]